MYKSTLFVQICHENLKFTSGHMVQYFLYMDIISSDFSEMSHVMP